MKVTPDIIRHEFIGTDAKISKSADPNCIGISGKVIDETRNTFSVLHSGKKKLIMKDSTVFQFKFSDGTVVQVDGRLLVGKPEDRLKKHIRRLW